MMLELNVKVNRVQYCSLASSYCMVTNFVALCESGTIRLVSERNSYFRRYGRVEICINQAWSTICDRHWDNVDASVVCRQLGFSPYGTTNNHCIN